MSLLNSTINQLANLKTLEQEIVEVLKQSNQPLSCSMILDRVESCPDRETLAREIFRLATAGNIVRAGNIPALDDRRKTMAIYQLPEANPEQAPTPAIAARAQEPTVVARKTENKQLSVIAYLREHGMPISAAELAQALGWPSKVILNLFTHLYKKGKVDFVKTSGTRRYILVANAHEKKTQTQADKGQHPVCAKSQTEAQGIPARPSLLSAALEASHKAKQQESSDQNAGKPSEEPLPTAEFGVFSSIRMSIKKGNQLVFLDREETLTLRRFLGCFEIEPSTGKEFHVQK